MRSNLFMSCIHFIMLSQEDGCCPLEPKQHQLQTHHTHPISGSLQYHSAAHIDTTIQPNRLRVQARLEHVQPAPEHQELVHTLAQYHKLSCCTPQWLPVFAKCSFTFSFWRLPVYSPG